MLFIEVSIQLSNIFAVAVLCYLCGIINSMRSPKVLTHVVLEEELLLPSPTPLSSVIQYEFIRNLQQVSFACVNYHMHNILLMERPDTLKVLCFTEFWRSYSTLYIKKSNIDFHNAIHCYNFQALL